MNWKTIVVVPLILTLSQSAGVACVNSSYSQNYEKQLTGDVFKLIQGQFAHHGDAFYESELTRTAGAADFEGVNDRAVALLKLKRYDEALALFESNDENFPERYKTHANLGVLYKKTGEYGKAADHIARSLEI
ncbi:MAG: tetratricopeptide repeat protein, partial [Planctomycetota bacterium]